MPQPCKIDKVVTGGKGRANPTILSFQSGVPLEEDNEVLYATEKADPTKKALVVAYRGTVDTIYRGTVNEGDTSKLIGTYIAIRNKTTNKVRLVEMDQCLLKSSHHYEKPEVAPGLEIDARSLLYKNFGSKSAMRNIERYEKTAYNADFVENKLNETVKESSEAYETKVTEEIEEILKVSSAKSGKYAKRK